MIKEFTFRDRYENRGATWRCQWDTVCLSNDTEHKTNNEMWSTRAHVHSHWAERPSVLFEKQNLGVCLPCSSTYGSFTIVICRAIQCNSPCYRYLKTGHVSCKMNQTRYANHPGSWIQFTFPYWSTSKCEFERIAQTKTSPFSKILMRWPTILQVQPHGHQCKFWPYTTSSRAWWLVRMRSFHNIDHVMSWADRWGALKGHGHERTIPSVVKTCMEHRWFTSSATASKAIHNQFQSYLHSTYFPLL